MKHDGFIIQALTILYTVYSCLRGSVVFSQKSISHWFLLIFKKIPRQGEISRLVRAEFCGCCSSRASRRTYFCPIHLLRFYWNQTNWPKVKKNANFGSKSTFVFFWAFRAPPTPPIKNLRGLLGIFRFLLMYFSISIITELAPVK